MMPGRSVRGRRDHASARGVLLVHGQGVQVHPVHGGEGIAQARLRVREQVLVEVGGAPRTLRPPGRMPSVRQPRRTHSCITAHSRSSPARVSASGRKARSFSSITRLMGKPVALAVLEQLHGVLEGVGQGARIFFEGRAPCRHALRPPRSRLPPSSRRGCERRPRLRVQGGEAHAVRVEGKALALEEQVVGLAEGDLLSAQEDEAPTLLAPWPRARRCARRPLPRESPRAAPGSRPCRCRGRGRWRPGCRTARRARRGIARRPRPRPGPGRSCAPPSSGPRCASWKARCRC